jgi:hypothetical protein
MAPTSPTSLVFTAPLKLFKLIIALVICYLFASLFQAAAMYILTYNADLPRMFWERMPWLLLLSPIYPAMTFDLLWQKQTWQSFGMFSLFLIPFVASFLVFFVKSLKK